MNFPPLRHSFFEVKQQILIFLNLFVKLLAAPPDALSGAFSEVGPHSTEAAEFDPQLIIHLANKLAANW